VLHEGDLSFWLTAGLFPSQFIRSWIIWRQWRLPTATFGTTARSLLRYRIYCIGSNAFAFYVSCGPLEGLHDMFLVKQIAAGWPYLLISIALIGLAYDAWSTLIAH
jgi:hypothetical protein